MIKDNYLASATEVAEEPSPVVSLSDAKVLIAEPEKAFAFTPAAISILGAALLAACGDSGSNSGAYTAVGADGAVAGGVAGTKGTNSAQSSGAITGQNNPVSAPGFNNIPTATSANDAARFLLQSQLSASDAELGDVQATTYAAYLQQQFAKPVGQTGWQWLEEKGYGASDANTYFFNTYPAEFMIWNQLFTAQDSMRKRVALGLSEFFVASMQSAEFTWRSHAFAQYWDILVKNAFGNFRQLLEDVTLSPAMGYYLNTKGNQKEDPASGRVPDENYGREVMQLFSIGLYQLNLDGTEKIDGSGKKIESYTQSDVTNIARVFTGYDFDSRANERFYPFGQSAPNGYTVEGREFTSRPMKLDATKHSTLASTFLGATVPTGATGAQALKIALDTLFNHPNVGPFFGRQMIQRFVTSNPSPEYVARVAAAFNNNGAGVRGDLKAVWTAIFLDDEARRNFLFTSSASAVPPEPADQNGIRGQRGVLNRNIRDLNAGKLREPMLRFIQWGRTFGIASAQNSWKLFSLSNASNQLGQSPLQSPSVFNFFRPGFIPPSSALATTNMTAPEFQIVNETTVGGYLNFMQQAIKDGLYCPEPTVPQAAYTNYLPDIKASYINELALVIDATALIKRINLLMAAGQVSDANQALMITAIASMPVNSTDPATLLNQKMNRIAAAVLMVMACSEYLIQK